MTPETIKLSDLSLGDTVRLGAEGFMDAVVRQIKDGKVRLFRPYVATADFVYTGGVIPYIGIEDFEMMVTDSATILRVRRADPKR